MDVVAAIGTAPGERREQESGLNRARIADEPGDLDVAAGTDIARPCVMIEQIS